MKGKLLQNMSLYRCPKTSTFKSYFHYLYITMFKYFIIISMRFQIVITVGLCCYKWYQSQTPSIVPVRTLAPDCEIPQSIPIRVWKSFPNRWYVTSKNGQYLLAMCQCARYWAPWIVRSLLDKGTKHRARHRAGGNKDARPLDCKISVGEENETFLR